MKQKATIKKRPILRLDNSKAYPAKSGNRIDGVLNNGINQFLQGISGVTQKQLSSEEGVRNNLRYNLVSLDRQLLQYLYANIGIIQTLIEQPVLDAYKKEFDIICPELDDEEIAEFKFHIKEQNLIPTIIELRTWVRLFGGGGMVLDVAGQDPSEPFDIKSIDANSKIAFYAADLWQLNQTKVEPRGEVLPYIQPVFEDDKPFLWFGQELHRTRVAKSINKKAPNNIRSQTRGWGMSEVERIIRDLNNFLKAENVIYELLDETKVTVHKISGFRDSLMSGASTNDIVKRLQAVEQVKSYLNSFITDGEDEVIQMQLDFTGISQILPELNKKIASAVKMPMTKLFGQSSAGFNSGEDDLENYNSMIESEIRRKDDHVIIWMLKIISKKLFGIVPKKIDIEYPSLREMTQEQMENVKTNKFNRARQMLEIGIWTDEEFNEYVEKEKLL
jgi:phage-related protein (TIGR01555 family)